MAVSISEHFITCLSAWRQGVPTWCAIPSEGTLPGPGVPVVWGAASGVAALVRRPFSWEAGPSSTPHLLFLFHGLSGWLVLPFKAKLKHQSVQRVKGPAAWFWSETLEGECPRCAQGPSTPAGPPTLSEAKTDSGIWSLYSKLPCLWSAILPSPGAQSVISLIQV